MTKKLSIVVLCCVISTSFLCFACNSAEKNRAKQEEQQKERRQEIELYATKINENPTALNKLNADTLINLYKTYINDYPKDTINEWYLFQLSQVYSAMNECDSALSCLDKIIKDFPNGNKVGAAYFFKGVIYNDVCLNKEESIKAFEQYINRYPNTKYTDVARKMIQMDTMKHPETLIK